MTQYYQFHASPLGELMLVSNENAITGLHATAGMSAPANQNDWLPDKRINVLTQARRELDAYFSGRLRIFSVALDPQGTIFQKLAWAALRRIPFGETRTYGQQAQAIGRPKAARAVGGANGRNPIGIIVPCHRVIGSDGTLTGYAGGLDNKRLLLHLEGSL